MRMPTVFICNDKKIETSISPGTTVLDFLRDHLFLRGTKAACREGDCGSCTVLVGDFNIDSGAVDYKAVTSCLLPLGDMAGKHVVSIEGINPEMDSTLSSIPLSPVQRIFVEEGATQCGFCTPGFIMSLTGFLLQGTPLTEAGGLDAVSGNICRCTGYGSIKRCITRLVSEYGPKLDGAGNRTDVLIREGIVPAFFAGVPERLKELMNMDVSGNQDSVPETKEAVLVGGGTDLYVQKPEIMPGIEIQFTSQKEDLSGIHMKDGWCRIGAGTSMESLKTSTEFQKAVPGFDGFANFIASKQIRTRATVGGNIINASPIGDLSVFFLSLDAELGIRSNKGERKKALKDFYLGYKIFDLHRDEYLAFVEFPLPDEAAAVNFEKVSRRTHLDIASVNSGIKIETAREDGDRVIQNTGISAGGVAPVPLYLQKTVDFLQGKKLEADVVKAAAETAQSEMSPISDVRGSAKYKRLLFRQLFFTHFVTLYPEQFAGGGLV